jgi:DNA-binding transcriptional regulator YdaS (Cro superfamily)
MNEIQKLVMLRPGITQVFIANQLGVSLSFVNQVISGAKKLPTKHEQKVKEIAKVYGIN